MTQRNYNVTPRSIAVNGNAEAYIDLAIRQAELTRKIYALQTDYTRHTRDLMTHLTDSPQPQASAFSGAPVTHSEHALVIRYFGVKVRTAAEEIAEAERALTKVKAELAELTENTKGAE